MVISLLSSVKAPGKKTQSLPTHSQSFWKGFVFPIYVLAVILKVLFCTKVGVPGLTEVIPGGGGGGGGGAAAEEEAEEKSSML